MTFRYLTVPLASLGLRLITTLKTGQDFCETPDPPIGSTFVHASWHCVDPPMVDLLTQASTPHVYTHDSPILYMTGVAKPTPSKYKVNFPRRPGFGSHPNQAYLFTSPKSVKKPPWGT